MSKVGNMIPCALNRKGYVYILSILNSQGARQVPTCL